MDGKDSSVPEEVGLNAEKLARAREWIAYHSAGSPYRLLVIRHGRIAVEWNQELDWTETVPIKSAVKSIYSNILGIAIAEGKLSSPDERVVDYFPEMMDVTEGKGPKEGRYAFPANREITFRQLISNTSGYMKPGEQPGTTFHYQTYGMNVLNHAVARLYGHYDVANPEESPGLKELIKTRIAEPIGAEWEYASTNFSFPPGSKRSIFGYPTQVYSNAHDLARLGWMWCCGGSWAGKQIVPRGWLEESTRVAPAIIEHEHEELHKYGYGFWTNQFGMLWHHWGRLPRGGYTPMGAGGVFVTVFPMHSLVVVQAPGPFERAGWGNPGLLQFVLDAVEE
jgi:CubicO group peptidase (beta-lactamase class C family)